MPRDNRTTDLKDLKNGAPYTWGELVSIHECGQYSIVEFHPWKRDKFTVLTGNQNVDERNFSPYIDDKNCNRSYDSLDAALVGAICLKHDGINTRADGYIMRMLGVGD